MLFEIFAWTSVMQAKKNFSKGPKGQKQKGFFQAGFLIAFGLGAYVLAPLANLVLARVEAGTVAYAVLPVAFYNHLIYGEKETDELRRTHLLNFALAEGLLVGFALSGRYLASLQPAAFLTPLCIGLSVQLVAPKLGNNRAAVFGACLGSAITVQLAFGLSLGLSFPYLLLTLLYAAAGFATLQLFLKFANVSYAF